MSKEKEYEDQINNMEYEGGFVNYETPPLPKKKSLKEKCKEFILKIKKALKIK